MNLPNRLTTLRVIMIPIFVVLVMLTKIYSWSRFIALVVFIAACVTDTLDGYLARKHNLVTNFGKFMDPLADKLLVCSALICLVHFDQIPTWIVLIIVAREFIISGFRLVAAEQGVVLAASVIAKVKTVVQMIMIGVLIADIPWIGFEILEIVLIYASLILTVVSLWDYIAKNIDILKGEM